MQRFVTSEVKSIKCRINDKNYRKLEVPDFTFPFLVPGSHLWAPGSQVPLEYFRVLGPT